MGQMHCIGCDWNGDIVCSVLYVYGNDLETLGVKAMTPNEVALKIFFTGLAALIIWIIWSE